jgi:hypothetical protein
MQPCCKPYSISNDIAAGYSKKKLIQPQNFPKISYHGCHGSTRMKANDFHQFQIISVIIREIRG